MSSLLSVAILFRHGARGPGDSEASAWEERDEVVSQWEHSELEKLSLAGVKQLKDVGMWFAKKYVSSELYIKTPKVYFRGSKSDRAVDSGRDFVNSFNATLSSAFFSESPTPFEEDADNYFRPWKVHTDSVKVVKAKMKNEKWAAKVEENKDFLARIRSELGMKEEYGANLSKALWSVTHIAGLIECETFWPNNKRNALISRVKEADYPRINDLACWVWQERFLSSGFEHLLGGWMFLDMIQRTFDPEYNLNVFSGHDYTILTLLALFPKHMPTLNRPIEFGSYVIFELWDGPPEATAASLAIDSFMGSVFSLLDVIQGSICAATPADPDARDSSCPSPDSSSPLSKRVLRLILNQQPFQRHNDKFAVDQPRNDGKTPYVESVRDDRSIVLADLNMYEVEDLVHAVIKSLHDVGLPAQFQMPTFV